MEYVKFYTKDILSYDYDVLLGGIRSQKGYTQHQLACMCGVSKNTISSIERGEFKPSLSLLIKLCIALECDFKDLVMIWDCETLDYIQL